MNISVQEISALERRVTVCIPADRLQQSFEGRLRSTARKAKVPGFRPGRATLAAVMQRYGEKIRRETVESLVEESLAEILREKKCNPVQNPHIESCSDTVKGLEYAAVFEVWPEIGKVNYGACEVERKTGVVDDTDIDPVVHRLRLERAQWQQVERMARQDDRVRFNFCLRNAQGQEQMKREDAQCILGISGLPCDMEARLSEMQIGESREYESVFPLEWGDEQLRGQPAHVHILLQQIEEPCLPELNEEFCTSLGVVEGGEAELRQQIRGQMENTVEDIVRRDIKTQILETLAQRHEKLPVPRALVERQIASNRARSGHLSKGEADENTDQSGTQVEEFERANAEKMTRVGLLLSEIANELDLQADSERVRAVVEREAAAYVKPEEIVRRYYEDRNLLETVQRRVLEEQLVEHILKEAKVVEKKLPYRELLQSDRQ